MRGVTPTNKAFVAVLVFALALIAGVLTHLPITQTMIPLLIFHGLLLINTFLSVRCFSAIIPPHNTTQNILDDILAGIYLAVPFALGNSLLFVFGITVLFIIATIKYIFLWNTLPHSRLLRRKLTVEAMGVVLCATTLMSIWLGYELMATSVWAGIFLIANIYLINISPLYQVDA